MDKLKKIEIDCNTFGKKAKIRIAFCVEIKPLLILIQFLNIF